MAFSSIDWRSAMETLKKFREDNVRASDDVVELGEHLITNYRSKLGKEIWNIYEQVFIAALDCGREDLAEVCLEALQRQFPKSTRVYKLEAMALEATGNFKEAEEVYLKCLSRDKANAPARKRLVAIYKAIGDQASAIAHLNYYLESFMTDQEAWMELADLYISLMDYSKAAFCMEELILTSPYNHYYYQRCAEIYYTMNGIENIESARKYFAQSLKLNSKNMRSLYGFFMASSQLLQSQKISSKSKKDNSRYAAWASAQIMEKYQVEKWPSIANDIPSL
ncbi:uncharacterized protein TRIADDRAFT_28044 [Trichoplax adhaerens]|uniref:ER membrane protein complex subunit 2 n=1 Tax=Trichoplax adhaerens TaxID=10228 RepID=B3S1Y5_TRIAD|nr:hypothetical protein TRIADDRAFT_28044 [Trichoplax adhaerens]EDV23588.1 hypothetical protein TRIADDRAFT_28044 [Trichoplax adhaerens]|eukprot:XP_002114498.1 hypothetical protein TRIADDRAFT_28044 [Trichoplax adhaerens]